jgi:hypothetical protein
MSVAQMETLIFYYFGIDAGDLSDDDFAYRWNQLCYALKWDGKIKTRAQMRKG